MDKNKKLVIIITSVIASILAGTIIFLSIFFHSQKQNNLQQEIATLKKEKDQLLAQVSQIDWQTYKGDFYDELKQKKFQQKKIQLQKKIQDLNVDCNQTDLEDQKECWLGFNHKITQTISSFQHFNNSYYQSYQTFNNTFNDTKNQFNDLLTNIGTLNITTFNNIQYDLDFLSPEAQNVFQNNKSQIIDHVQQFNNSNVTDQEVKKTCSQNKTLYQQLKCYQEKNQFVNKTLNEFNNFGNHYQNIYQLFNISFNNTKNQFQDLLTIVEKINITEFSNKEYDLDFLSPQDQKTFQSNKSQIIDTIKQLNHSNIAAQIKKICSQDKTLYQQLECYQEKNQFVSKTLNEFNNFGNDYQKSYQIFNVTFEAEKTKLEDLLTNFGNQEYDLGFVSPQDQKIFQDGKNAFVVDAQQKNTTCFHNKTLYQQAMCCQQQNQLINKAIESFNNNYYDEYQTFNVTFNNTKKQFSNLLTNIAGNMTELNDTKFDLAFFNPEAQKTFQNNKNQIIQQLSNVQTTPIETCVHNKNLYQQAECYQQKNEAIVKQLNSCQTFEKQYLNSFKSSLPVTDINQGIKKIKTELEDIFDQDPDNVKTDITKIVNQIQEFEKEVKKYQKQPWEFKNYYHLLVQYQDHFQKAKVVITNIESQIAAIKAKYHTDNTTDVNA